MCAMFIVAPGRFAYGIILVLELLFLMLTGTLFNYLLKILKMQKLSSITLLFFIVFDVLFFRQLLILTMPELALSLGFVIFLPAVSTFTFSFLFGKENDSLKEDLKNNLMNIFKTSVYGFFISLIRDILGYGTFTFISFNGLIEKVIFNSETNSFFTFFATIPGGIILYALVLVIYMLVLKRMDIIKKAGVEE